VKKTIIFLMAGLLILTSCGKLRGLLKTDNSIVIKEEKTWKDNVKRYWHASRDFAYEYRYAIIGIGMIVSNIIIWKIAWKRGKRFCKKRRIENNFKEQVRELSIKYSSLPDEYLQGINNNSESTSAEKEAVKIQFNDRKKHPFDIKGHSLDLLRILSFFSSEDLATSRGNYYFTDEQVRATAEFILQCRGFIAPPEAYAPSFYTES
jgi:hypothetical protein